MGDDSLRAQQVSLQNLTHEELLGLIVASLQLPHP